MKRGTHIFLVLTFNLPSSDLVIVIFAVLEGHSQGQVSRSKLEGHKPWQSQKDFKNSMDQPRIHD